MKVIDKYYVGLDLGTSSVGWAVTDDKYQLLRAKGKDLWGVRLFEEADVAAGRRVNRVSRRRRQREVARIGLLKEYFAEELSKVDSNFLERLAESKYHREDKKVATKYGIFADDNYTDEDYFREYPTIFHLRYELIQNPQAHDVRLVYLALLNMFKHRGHFLNAGLKTDGETESMEDIYGLLYMTAQEWEIELPETVDFIKMKDILSRRDISRTVMTEQLSEAFAIEKKKNKQVYEILKGFCGLAVSLNTLFSREEFDENHKKVQISFRDSKYDEKIEEYSSFLSEEEVELIGRIKQIHDLGVLSNVMKGSKYLSEARIREYDKHKQDLKILKRVIREYSPDKYDSMFRELEPGSYSAYVGSVNSGESHRRNVKDRQREDLYATIKKILKDIPDNEDKEYILKEMELEAFLPKQLTASNGIIPNQVHVIEMKKILSNAEGYLPFLKETDESNLTVSERILQLFEFQIPYYVGPLNLQHKNMPNGHAWAVRKKEGRVLPWNIEEMIDIKQSSEEFINRMVRHCTYLQGERAIPKDSLLYERYCVLNELNNLQIHGERISPQLKQNIFCTLFEKGKHVTQKQLFQYLVREGILEETELDAISGIDKDFKNALTSYGKFKAVFGESIKLDSTKKMVEDIIYWGTIYGDDKKFLREKIKDEYGECVTEEQLRRIAGFKFHDWGRLSRAFLQLSGCEKGIGEKLSLIDMMWENNYNLMELMSDKFTYQDSLAEMCENSEKVLKELEYEDLEDLYLSAPVKRMIWQTVLVLKDIEHVLGKEPSRVFVEMPREDGDKGVRKDSRKQKLKELYKGCKVDSKNWIEEIDGWSDQELRSKKLYLYYMQQGRCMYTGEIIDLHDLFNDNLYDIDHIYPRHFVKDDSLENNLVLVKKEVNAHKSDTYPIEKSIYDARHNWWRSLLTADMQSKFITREKYNRLVNRNEFTDEQLTGFISRQIVETRQGTKVVAHLFEEMFPTSEVVYVKAGNVSAFRQERKLLKSRVVNDFHHAQDAYLNIVVGNTYFVKFTRNPANFIREYRKNATANRYHINKMFDNTVERNGEIAWVAAEKNGASGTIQTVRAVMAKNSPLITRMNFESHGQIAEATLYGAKNANEESYIPLKESDERLQDVSKYGGFNSISITYFFLVEHTKGKKRIRTIEAMPLYLKDKIGTDKKALVKYCEEQLGLIEPDIRLEKIKIQSLIKRNGFYLYISGKSINQITVRNAVPLCLKQDWITYIKGVEKVNETGREYSLVTAEKNLELYEILMHKHMTGVYAKRPNSVGSKLVYAKDKFASLEINEQCMVLMQILQLSQLSSLVADLRLIGESKNTGSCKISKNITDTEEFKLIHQSPSGLFETEIDLKTI